MEPKKYLFAASTGGHLAQLVRLAPDLNASPDSVWVTFDTPQSRSLLAGRRVVHVPYIGSRDYMGVLRAVKIVRNLIKAETFDQAASTGAGLALAVLPQARLSGIPSTYIESVSRVSGPSLTGRLIAATHTCSLYTQHAGWAGGRWKAHRGVLNSFRAVPKPAVEQPKLFVSLGTISKYRFDSLVDGLIHSGAADERTIWQVGTTTRNDLPGTVHKEMEASEFAAAARQADVVVTHSGVGTLLQLFDMGIYPVVVPRDKTRLEHVDNHQYQIAELVDERKIGLVVEARELSMRSIVQASGKRVVSTNPNYN